MKRASKRKTATTTLNTADTQTNKGGDRNPHAQPRLSTLRPIISNQLDDCTALANASTKGPCRFYRQRAAFTNNGPATTCSTMTTHRPATNQSMPINFQPPTQRGTNDTHRTYFRRQGTLKGREKNEQEERGVSKREFCRASKQRIIAKNKNKQMTATQANKPASASTARQQQEQSVLSCPVPAPTP